jgi:NAD(P)-dependent dehydrogenase (short-subunit alcohol dehydrogenase family)
MSLRSKVAIVTGGNSGIGRRQNSRYICVGDVKVWHRVSSTCEMAA